MGGLGPLLASFAAIDIAAFTHKLKRNVVLYAFMLVFVLTAYVLGVAALAVHLATLWGMPIALLAVAGGALVLALIFYLCVAIANSAEKKRKRQAAATGGGKALMITAALSALPLIVKSKPLMFASVAGGIGLLLTRGLSSSGRYSDPAE